MLLTVVALMCHMMPGITSPVCHEEIVTRQLMSLQQCMMSQAAVADWKEKSIYRGDQWLVGSIRCLPGDYLPRDVI